jgi:hypothetical protein
MDGEGTIRYSTGRPGRENAAALPTLPTTLTVAHIINAASAAIVSRFLVRHSRLLTPKPNVVDSLIDSKRERLCVNPKRTVSRLSAKSVEAIQE